MLRPVIMIGCGGSGSKAVRYVRDAVQRKLRHSGWTDPMPPAWSFIGLDTLTVQEDSTEIPTLPAEDFLSVSLGLNKYSDVHDGLMARHPVSSTTYPHILGWRPSPHDVQVPLLGGAGQYRAVGRVVGLLASRTELQDRIDKAFTTARAGGPVLGQVSQRLGLPPVLGSATPAPIVVICSSVAGGTGAGIALDIVEMVRRTDQLGAYPVLVLFTADIFNFKASEEMAANSLGLLSETLASYWRERSDDLFPSAVAQPGSGPHALFMVGRFGIEGGDLGDTISVYRAVGEAMSTWVTEPRVQDQIHNFITVNWQKEARKRMRGYPFGNEFQTGAVSSFGAATVTLGRDRFERWATDLLARKTLEILVQGHHRQRLVTGNDADLPDLDRVEVLASKQAGAIYEGRPAHPPSGLASAREHFASKQTVKEVIDTIRGELKEPFRTGITGSGDEWRRWLDDQVRRFAPKITERAQIQDPSSWGTEMVRATCAAASEVAADTSLEVAEKAVRNVIAMAKRDADQLRQTAKGDRKRARQDYKRVRAELAGHKGKLGRDTSPIDEAFEETARALARQWRGRRLDQVAEIVESTVDEVLDPAAIALQTARTQAAGALRQDDVAAWPADEVIPKAYLPATVEFPLEKYDTWVTRLNELCNDAVSQYRRTAEPVDAVVRLMITGNEDELELKPVLTPTKWQNHWSPGAVAHLSCEAGADDIRKRVKTWTRAPESRFMNYVHEGLGNYLKETDPVTKERRVDHFERMEAFRLNLQKAVVHSQPLVQINQGLHATVYTREVEINRMCSPFPFQEGHPASEIARAVVGKDKYRVADRDTSSVLISSYIGAPVHPMVIQSLTLPIAKAVASFGDNDGWFRATFWLWRRARTLNSFVPLAPELLAAMIRGFAVGRLCGYVTADPDRPQISSPDGPVTFPQPMLSKVTPDDMLAGLLETFSLCFAKVDAGKLSSFEGYKVLYELGELSNQIHPDLRHALNTGNLPRETVDSPKVVGDDPPSRKAAAVNYLDSNIRRLDRLTSGFDGTECKGTTGWAAKDVPTREIAGLSAACYRQVRDALGIADAGVV